tara:strand:- start:119 stop:583 length:465 start_codon:yes stop_codon:yes gene_type:complete
MKKKNLLLGLIISLLFACSQNEESAKNLYEAENFLEENKNNSVVIEIEEGLQYSVLESGSTYLNPKNSDVINADFHGTLLDGSVFWSSIENGEPLVIPLSQLIPGCQKAIALMQVGDKWRVFIHPALAYGEQGRPGIPANSLLIFDISLHSIET